MWQTEDKQTVQGLTYQFASRFHRDQTKKINIYSRVFFSCLLPQWYPFFLVTTFSLILKSHPNAHICLDNPCLLTTSLFGGINSAKPISLRIPWVNELQVTWKSEQISPSFCHLRGAFVLPLKWIAYGLQLIIKTSAQVILEYISVPCS